MSRSSPLIVYTNPLPPPTFYLRIEPCRQIALLFVSTNHPVLKLLVLSLRPHSPHPIVLNLLHHHSFSPIPLAIDPSGARQSRVPTSLSLRCLYFTRRYDQGHLRLLSSGSKEGLGP